MAERKAWWEILRDQFASRGLLDPESERVQETVRAAPAAQRQARGLLSLDPQAESDTALEMGLGALPGVGQAMALRDLERARRAKDPGAAAMAASNFVPFGTLLNRFRRGPMSELDVYHGTPHTYAPTEANPLGEFDASKIGTGEGAQAYGHGIYLAESPGVADAYRTMLAPMPRLYKNGTPFEAKTHAEMLAESRALGAGSVDEAIARQARKLQAGAKNGGGVAVLETVGRELEEERRIFDALGNLKTQGYQPGLGGSLYKADLPDEMIDRMLDWDKPLSEQSAAVKEMLRKSPLAPDESVWPQWTGQQFYEAEVRAMTEFDKLQKGPSRASVSDAIRQTGIPGIKYLDAGSRGQGGSGTRNFVVFPGEEKKVKILERK